MKKNYSTDKFEPPTNLFDKIMSRILIEQTIVNFRRKFWLGVSGFCLFFIIGISVWQTFMSEITESGFVEYATMFLSNFGAALDSWQDFALSLLQSLPVVSLLELLTVIFMLILFAKVAAKYSGPAFRRTQLIN